MAFYLKIQTHQDAKSLMVQRWLIEEGQYIDRLRPIVVIRADDEQVTIRAQRDGILLGKYVQDGENFEREDELATIISPEEAGRIKITRTLTARDREILNSLNRKPKHKHPHADHLRATPAARSLASQYGISLFDVHGSGPDGRIQKSDVMRFVRAGEEETKDKNQRVLKLAGKDTGSDDEAAKSKRLKKVRISPLARKMAQSYGIDLKDVKSHGGKIGKEDVLDFLGLLTPAESASLAPADEIDEPAEAEVEQTTGVIADTPQVEAVLEEGTLDLDRLREQAQMDHISRLQEAGRIEIDENDEADETEETWTPDEVDLAAEALRQEESKKLFDFFSRIAKDADGELMAVPTEVEKIKVSADDVEPLTEAEAVQAQSVEVPAEEPAEPSEHVEEAEIVAHEAEMAQVEESEETETESGAGIVAQSETAESEDSGLESSLKIESEAIVSEEERLMQELLAFARSQSMGMGGSSGIQAAEKETEEAAAQPEEPERSEAQAIEAEDVTPETEENEIINTDIEAAGTSDVIAPGAVEESASEPKEPENVGIGAQADFLSLAQEIPDKESKSKPEPIEEAQPASHYVDNLVVDLEDDEESEDEAAISAQSESQETTETEASEDEPMLFLPPEGEFAYGGLHYNNLDERDQLLATSLFDLLGTPDSDTIQIPDTDSIIELTGETPETALSEQAELREGPSEPKAHVETPAVIELPEDTIQAETEAASDSIQTESQLSDTQQQNVETRTGEAEMDEKTRAWQAMMDGAEAYDMNDFERRSHFVSSTPALHEDEDVDVVRGFEQAESAETHPALTYDDLLYGRIENPDSESAQITKDVVDFMSEELPDAAAEPDAGEILRAEILAALGMTGDEIDEALSFESGLFETAYGGAADQAEADQKRQEAEQKREQDEKLRAENALMTGRPVPAETLKMTAEIGLDPVFSILRALEKDESHSLTFEPEDFILLAIRRSLTALTGKALPILFQDDDQVYDVPETARDLTAIHQALEACKPGCGQAPVTVVSLLGSPIVSAAGAQQTMSPLILTIGGLTGGLSTGGASHRARLSLETTALTVSQARRLVSDILTCLDYPSTMLIDKA